MRVSGVLPFLLAIASLLLVDKHCSVAAQPPEKAKADEVKVPGIEELLLFFPAKHPAGDWAPQGLQFQDVWFAAEDGTRLNAWYCPSDQPRATVLIAHGNGGNITSRAAWLKHLQMDMKVSVLLFDYRGYGRSEGVPTVEGILQDARAARTKLCALSGCKSSEIVLMGESLGGAVAVQLAAESAPRGLVLQSTFSSLRDVAEVHYPMLAWVVPTAKLNSTTAIADYRGPLLQSHGQVDQTIPIKSGQKLFEAAKGPKKFVLLQGVDHNDWLTAEYLQSFDEFIVSVANASK